MSRDLAERGFRLFWLGETASALGTSVSRTALPFVAVVTLHAGTLAVALLTAAVWSPWLLIGLPAGAWVDRLPLRPLMLVCDVASLVVLLSVPIAAWAGILTISQLFVTALLAGVASVFFQTAYQVFIPSLVTGDRLPRANAMLHASESVAQVAGPSLAGLIAQVVGAVGGLVADAVSFAISGVCLLSVRETAAPARAVTVRRGLRTEMGEGLRLIASDPYLRTFSVFGAASNLALTGYQSILVVFLIRDLGVSPGGVGLLISGMSVGGVVGAAGAAAVVRRWGTGRGLLVSELCTAPFGLLVPLAAPGARLLLVVVGGLVVGAGVVCGNVIKSSWRQAYCPLHLLGRVVVGMQFLNYGAIPLGALIAGLLGTAIGVRPSLWILLGCLSLAPTVLLTGPVRRNRQLPGRLLPAMPS